MKKLPKIYQNELNKVKNNKSVFDSLKDINEEIKEVKEIKNKEYELDNLSVKEKIKRLINQNSYIFNLKVLLIYDNQEEVTKIAGIVDNHIITMDNKIIKIDDLDDIKIIK